jgi:hypothetical protein
MTSTLAFCERMSMTTKYFALPWKVEALGASFCKKMQGGL